MGELYVIIGLVVLASGMYSDSPVGIIAGVITLIGGSIIRRMK